MFYAAKASAAFLCQQNRWSVCHGIGCNISPKRPVEVLKWLYMPKNRTLIESERKGIADEIVKKRAEQAYNLLHSWKSIPGVDKNGDIDVDYLNNWITVARNLASEADRVEVADIQIGSILAQYPEKDLNWPPDPISEVIETINTDSLKTNFSAAVFNKRGSSSRGPFDGGNIERAHAEYFKKLSAYHKNKHRQVAAIFNRLSKGYLEQAKQMDIMAERDRLEY